MKPFRSLHRRPKLLTFRLLALLVLGLCVILFAANNFRPTYSRSDDVLPSWQRGSQSHTGDDFPSTQHPSARATAVRNAFLHAWNGYKQFAWGHDELRPLSQNASDGYGKLGLTIVDSLDTLILMGLEEEYLEARNWVETDLRYEKATGPVSFFETVIRHLGGLLSSYYLSGDAVFLEKATDLGERLLRAYRIGDSPLPYPTVSFADTESERYGDPVDISIAEATTTVLEFGALSALSGDDRFIETAERTLDELFRLPAKWGLRGDRLGLYLFTNYGALTLGANADSHYEYLLKRYIQLKSWGGGKEQCDKYEKAYVAAMEGLEGLLAVPTIYHGATFLGERSLTGELVLKMDHLSCFVPGMLALGARTVGGRYAKQHMRLAERIAYTCYRFHIDQVTGLSPEAVYLNDETEQLVYHMLRPETVESFYVLYKITGDPKYREWGWTIFQNWEKHAKIPSGGYSGLNDVSEPRSYNDNQDSFFLAESLKYLYLLFEDDSVTGISLFEWVFNTEAHPLSLDRNWRSDVARQKLATRFNRFRALYPKDQYTEFQ